MKSLKLLGFSAALLFLGYILGAGQPRILAQEENTDFTTAVEKVADKIGPTVVSIKIEKTQKIAGGQPFSFGGPFQDEFFDKFFKDFMGRMPEGEQKLQGLGSGVIIDPRGYILTNEHVISGADKITVVLPDGRSFEGQLKGTDPRSDLAVIKIEAADLPVAPLGDSEKIKIGEWVVAIGNPFGHILTNPQPTVTAGVISALQRSLPKNGPQEDRDYSDLIQTDAAINPGNSGGPLVNLKGEVIGINVAIFSTTGGYQGIGFAIPSNDAKLILNQLIEGKEIAYGWIGVSVQEIDEKLADYFSLPARTGVLVAQVIKDGPAQKAGLREGDVILSVAGKEVKNASSLVKIVGSCPVGKKTPLTILRDGKKSEIAVMVTKRPRFDQFGRMIEEDEVPQEAPQEEQVPSVIKESQWRGLTAGNITPQITQQLKLESGEGVVVTEIKNNTPAEEAGLRPGDIIISINQKSIKNARDFAQVTKSLNGRALIRTLRGFLVLEE